MRAGRRCTGIIFDLDDTLVPTSKIDRAAIRTAAQAVISAGGEAVDKCSSNFAQLLKAEPFPPEESGLDVPSWRTRLWARALSGGSTQDVSPAATLAHDTWSAERLGNFRFDGQVTELIRRLQAAGYSTGVLTNGHKDVQRAKTAACGAGALFGESKVVIAGEYPEQKPHASIFRVACAALGVAAEQTVMVGDSYKADIAGGISAGLLATIWVHEQQPPEDAGGAAQDGASMAHDFVADVPPGQPPPTYTVRSVLDLEAVLEQIG